MSARFVSAGSWIPNPIVCPNRNRNDFRKRIQNGGDRKGELLVLCARACIDPEQKRLGFNPLRGEASRNKSPLHVHFRGSVIVTDRIQNES
jgi:hypothetical protein